MKRSAAPQTKVSAEEAAAAAAAAAAALVAERAAAVKAAVLHTPGTAMRRYLQVFGEVGTADGATLPRSSLGTALEKAGIPFDMRELQKSLTEVYAEGKETINFAEFCRVAALMRVSQAKIDATGSRTQVRTIRQYLTPESCDQYSAMFRERAGEAGRLSIDELDIFFKEKKVNVPFEHVQVIMQEMDYDHSGFLDEGEFTMLLIKASGIKKRKVGPGMCALTTLKQEGWSFHELREVGYDLKDFLEAGHTLAEVLNVFPVSTFTRAGMSLAELLAAGWDLAGARQAGLAPDELLKAGCSIRTIRTAGWNDLASAVMLRTQQRIDARRMKLAGWSLSDLKAAGYSTASLHEAGFSAEVLTALQRVLARKESRDVVQRKNTFQLRREVEKHLLLPNKAEA